MTEVKALIKHSSHYLSGRIVLMLLGFVSFPILARVYSVDDYGRISLALKIVLLFTVLGKFGLQNSVQRFFPEEMKGEPARQRRMYTTILAAVAVIGVIITVCFLSGVALIPQSQISPALRSAFLMAGVLIGIRAVQPTAVGFLRAAGRTGMYNFVDITTKAGTVLLMIAGFEWVSRGMGTFFGATILAEGLVLLLLIVYFMRQHLLVPGAIDYTLAKRVLWFGLPLIGYELASVLLDSGDRILVNHYLGPQALGHYSAAYNICTYVEESLMTPINLALFPVYMKLWVDRGEQATTQFLNRSLEMFLILAVAVATFVISCARPIVIVLASKKFEHAQELLPILVIGLLIYAVHIFFNAPLMIHNRPFTMTKLVVYACVLNLVMNVALLRFFGVQAAAISTLVSYLALVIALAVESRKLMRVTIRVKSLLLSVVCAAICYVVLSFISSSHPLVTIFERMVVGAVLYLGLLLAVMPEMRQAATRFFSAKRVTEPVQEPAEVA